MQKRHTTGMFALIIFVSIVAWSLTSIPKVHAQFGTSHLQSFAPLTLSGSKQQLNTSYVGTCLAVQIAAPSANSASFKVGDSTISSSIGFTIPAGGARYFAPLGIGSTWDLSTIYVLGTLSDTVQFDCIK